MKLLKCEVCGKIVEVVKDTQVPLMCCGKPMKELVANTEDGAHEKHIPVVEVNGDSLYIKVGEVEHPMIETHWITHIFVVMGNKVLKVSLKPKEKPEATVLLNGYKGKVEVYEYCNLHGLYKTELDV